MFIRFQTMIKPLVYFKTIIKQTSYTKRFIYGTITSASIGIISIRQFLIVPVHQHEKYEYPDTIHTRSSIVSLPDNGSVVHVSKPEAEYYLLGNLHFGSASPQQVHDLLPLLKPDVVMIELCAKRFQQVSSMIRRWNMIDFPQLTHWSDRVHQLVAQQQLPPWDETVKGARSIFTTASTDRIIPVQAQKQWHRLNQMEYWQGYEQLAAIQYAMQVDHDCLLVLGDLDIDHIDRTEQHVKQIYIHNRKFQSESLSKTIDDVQTQNLYDTIKESIYTSLLGTLPWIGTHEQRKQLYANYNHREVCSGLSYEREEARDLVVIKERDLHMCKKLIQYSHLIPVKSSGDKPVIVAVVGMAHLDGIEKLLLNDTPSPSANDSCCLKIVNLHSLN